MSGPAFIHASCVVVGEAGVLIRGASGSGKSELAIRLIDAAGARGLFARLVGDDRVAVSAVHGRLLVRPHRAIEHMIEMRGLGITATPSEKAVIVRLVADCSAEVSPRMPAPDDAAEVAGIRLPRIDCRPEDERLVLTALGFGNFTVQSTE